MAIIKSYTDINQSRKLVEILPFESADMWWAERYAGQVMANSQYIVEEKPMFYLSLTKPSNSNCSQDIIKDIPCWSLAALLSVIPYNVSFNKAVYRFKLVKFPNYWECYHESFGCVSTEVFKANNPIDVCYQMIIKLNELNLL